MTRSVLIADRAVGDGQPPYLVAELSANHNGEIERALRIMELAKTAGVDAVKLQTYTADTMTIDSDSPDFLIEGGLWDGYSLYDLYSEASTPWEWHAQLFEKGRELGITVFSTPFDESAVDFLETFDPPAYKIASFEATDLPLVRRVAATGKPIIASTGMSTREEIGELVETARSAGTKDLILLHCISSYPAPVEDTNLRTIRHMAETFDVVVGLSDHTLGTTVAIAGVSAGAALIEKHVTLQRSDGGPDAAFSLEPPEILSMVENCNTAWLALGHVNYDRTPSEKANLKFRRSIYATADIAAGETLTKDNIRSIRPGLGLPPKYIDTILGQQSVKAITRGTPISWALLYPGQIP